MKLSGAGAAWRLAADMLFYPVTVLGIAFYAMANVYFRCMERSEKTSMAGASWTWLNITLTWRERDAARVTATSTEPDRP